MSRAQRFGVPFFLLLVLAASIGPPVAAQGTKEARGTVTAVTDTSLKVKAGTQEMTFAVDPKTTVTAEGAGRQTREAKATGAAGIKLTGIIKTGEAVIVNYTESGGTLRASAIRAVATAGAGGGGVASPSPASRTANGTVKSVTGSSLIVTSSGKDMTFSITPDTLVQGRGVGTAASAAGGKIAIASVVGAGDTVSVSYQESGTTMRATEVRVTAKAAK
jgi:Domain of unknown function (DUF5666)